ncbi:MAG: hypothetical protein EOM91_18435 [Sphingobacteriia bacterium]|nr:hypothetical protein [Sphingobacteriia bacterium]
MSEPNRSQIASEILAAIDEAGRPITLSEMYEASPSAEDRASVARVASYLKSTKAIEVAGEVQPGEPGGMTGKGARVVSAYRRVPEAGVKKTADSAWLEDAKAQFDRVNRAPIQDVERCAESFEILETPEKPIDISMINSGVPSDCRFNESRQAGHEWDPDAARMAPPVDRYDEDSLAILIHGHEEMMLEFADDHLRDNRVWALMRQQYQAMREL